MSLPPIAPFTACPRCREWFPTDHLGYLAWAFRHRACDFSWALGGLQDLNRVPSGFTCKLPPLEAMAYLEEAPDDGSD